MTTQLEKDIEKARQGEPVDFGIGFTQPQVDLDQNFVAPQALPRSGNIRLPKPVIQNQQYGVCGAACVASGMSSLIKHESGMSVALDMMDLYASVSTNLDGGIFPDAAAQIAVDHGAPALNRGGKWRLESYAFIAPQDHAAIKGALRNGMPIVFAAWLDDKFWQNSDQRIPVTLGSDASATSYHAMCAYDFDEAGNYLDANSWGPSWSDGGVTRLTPEWWNRRVTHVWALTDKPDQAGGFTKGWTVPESDQVMPRIVHRPGKPALYAVMGNALMWISSMTDASYHKIDISKRQEVPLDDEVWSYPVYLARPPASQA